MKLFNDHQNLKYLSLGIEIAAGLSIPILVGFWIDRTWGTLPWFTFLGILLGVGTMMIIIIRVAREMSDKNRD